MDNSTYAEQKQRVDKYTRLTDRLGVLEKMAVGLHTDIERKEYGSKYFSSSRNSSFYLSLSMLQALKVALENEVDVLKKERDSL